MDTPSGSGEFVDAEELERLRRRAYGPDADIAGDAAAQARLAELEAAQRRRVTAVDAAAEVPAPVRERVRVAEPGDGQRLATTLSPQPVDGVFAENPAGGSVTEHDTAERPITNGAQTEPWWRRRRWLLVLGGAIAVVALITGYVAGMSRLLVPGSTPIPTESSTAKMPPVRNGIPQRFYLPSPHEILALRSVGADADQPNDRHGVLELLGISPDELRRYDDFDGLNIWSGESRDGMTCLFVAVPGQGIREGYGSEGCSPEGFDTVVELPQQGNNSFRRFVLRDDHVDVYVYKGAVNESSEPKSVAQLTPQGPPDQGSIPVDDETAVAWDVTVADFVSYGSYGPLEIWSTTKPEGKRCLAVVGVGDNHISVFRCTAPSVDTIADFNIDPSVVPRAPSGEPTENIRFVLHDEVVDVYLPHPEGGFY